MSSRAGGAFGGVLVLPWGGAARGGGPRDNCCCGGFWGGRPPPLPLSLLLRGAVALCPPGLALHPSLSLLLSLLLSFHFSGGVPLASALGGSSSGRRGWRAGALYLRGAVPLLSPPSRLLSVCGGVALGSRGRVLPFREHEPVPSSRSLTFLLSPCSSLFVTL